MFMCLYHDGTQRYKVVLVFEYIFEPSAGKSESHTLPFNHPKTERKETRYIKTIFPDPTVSISVLVVVSPPLFSTL